MKLLVAFLSTCALALGAALPRFDDKIIGGDPTTIEEHPYQVSLHYYGNPHCGGAIINEKTILTACNCVQGFTPKGFSVRVGSANNQNGEEYEIARIIRHPDYMKDVLYNNDVAVLKLTTPLTFSDKVQPVALQPADNPAPAGTKALVTGWGTVIAGLPSYTEILYVAEVELIPHARCEKLYAGERGISETMLCTHTFYRDACDGDSGAPLVANGSLVGLASWRRGCADHLYPSVYTNVSALHDFIDQYL